MKKHNVHAMNDLGLTSRRQLHVVATQGVQADGWGRPAKAPVIVSIAFGLDGGLVEASTVSTEAAESLAQDAPTSTFVHDPVVSGILVVIQHGHEVSYLIADDGRV